MHYLITGHTGFKGSWLAVLLKSMGHTVSGLSLPPEPKSLFAEGKLADLFNENHYVDIREMKKIESSLKLESYDFVFHLAAQPFVRESYRKPYETFETNIQGTLNILQGLENSIHPLGALIITTDKVYLNDNTGKQFNEDDPLGGEDPYSASKAASDIVVQAWARSVSTFPVAIARAGNVIGGGDWGADRLMPDLVSSYSLGNSPVLRHPESIRPWQHVLDCLYGYFLLSDSVIQDSVTGVWNFGPSSDSIKTVEQVNHLVAQGFKTATNFTQTQEANLPLESHVLILNSDKARTQLSWSNKLSFEDSINWTVDFYIEAGRGKSVRKLMEDQIEEYLRYFK